jgi:hypothetical protein
MAPVVYRPAPLSNTVLAEVVCADFEQRIKACNAVISAVLSQGYQACQSPAERHAWCERIGEYFLASRSAWLGICADDAVRDAQSSPARTRT